MKRSIEVWSYVGDRPLTVGVVVDEHVVVPVGGFNVEADLAYSAVTGRFTLGIDERAGPDAPARDSHAPAPDLDGPATDPDAQRFTVRGGYLSTRRRRERVYRRGLG